MASVWYFPRHSRLLKKHEILASSFDKLRMRPRIFNGLILMVSLSNHGQHHFFSILIERAGALVNLPARRFR